MDSKNNFEGKKWIKQGLFFGVFMYFFNVILFPLISRSDQITLKKVLLGIPVWVIGGLAYGYTMKWYFTRKNKK